MGHGHKNAALSVVCIAILTLHMCSESGVLRTIRARTTQKIALVANKSSVRHEYVYPAKTVNEEDHQHFADASWTSPACKPSFLSNGQQIEKIVFHHMRKAGGTLLRQYLKKVCEEYNLTYRAYEGRGPPLDDGMENNTLYVTNLREPVSRTISHYKYDQRWDCKDLMKKSFQPSQGNLKRTLEDFIAEPHSTGNKEKRLWGCATNCYTRWVTGHHEPLDENCSSTLRKHEVTKLEEARDVLLKYNLILITEKMRYPKYTKKIEKMFGVRGLTKTKASPYCGRVSAAANEKLPLIIANETLKRLNDCVTPDSTLYKQLTTCPEGFRFPKFSKEHFSLQK